MESNDLFRKECMGEDIFAKERNEYSKLPTPQVFVIRIVVVIALLFLLMFAISKKIDLSYYTFAYVSDNKMWVYLTNENLPQIDDNTEIIVANKVIKLKHAKISRENFVPLSDEIEDDKQGIEALSKLYYTIELDNVGLPDELYEVKVKVARKSLIDYILDIGKDE